MLHFDAFWVAGVQRSWSLCCLITDRGKPKRSAMEEDANPDTVASRFWPGTSKEPVLCNWPPGCRDWLKVLLGNAEGQPGTCKNPLEYTKSM